MGSGSFLSNGLELLIRDGLPLMKNVLSPLSKNVLIPLGLTAASSATDTAIQKKIHGSGTAKLIILKEEIKGTMK